MYSNSLSGITDHNILYRLSCTQVPSEKGSTLKGKNLLPMGANCFLLEQTLFQKQAKKANKNFDRLASPLKVYIGPIKHNDCISIHTIKVVLADICV